MHVFAGMSQKRLFVLGSKTTLAKCGHQTNSISLTQEPIKKTHL